MQRNYQLTLGGPARLPEAARERLTAAGKRRKFADGATIYTQGDEADGFGIVVSGKVRMSRCGADGGCTVYGVMGAGDVFGEQAFFTGTPRSASVDARGPTEIVWVSAPVFRRALAGDSELSLLLLRSLSLQLHRAMHMLDQARRLSAADRLAMVLETFHCGADGVVEATHQELADLVGLSRVSLGSALGQLAQSGAIQRSYGHVRIINRGALERRTAMHRAG